MAKLLITGISGFVGMHMSYVAANHFEIFGTYCNNSPILRNTFHIHRLDLTEREMVFRWMASNQPDFVIHAAGTRDVNLCERDHEYAFKSHVISTRNLVDALSNSSIPLVYLSTDSVFPGIKEYYSEFDNTSPVNQYGKVKLIAEEYIIRKLSKYILLRTSVMYGWTHGNQLSNTVLDTILSLRRKVQITLSNATYNTPLYVLDACKITMKLLKYPSINGIVHLAGDTRLSRFELGLRTAQVFELNKQLINVSEKRLANRPVNSCLQMRVIPESIGISPCSLMSGLTQMKEDGVYNE